MVSTTIGGSNLERAGSLVVKPQTLNLVTAGSIPAPLTNTVNTGDISEAVILAELIKRGITVLIPWGNNQRFDFVTYDGDNFSRVQVKTGRIKDESVVEFNAQSTNLKNGRWVRSSYHGEVDVFMVYVPEIAKIYSIPAEEAIGATISFRLTQAKNNQKRRIRVAKAYEF